DSNAINAIAPSTYHNQGALARSSRGAFVGFCPAASGLSARAGWAFGSGFDFELSVVAAAAFWSEPAVVSLGRAADGSFAFGVDCSALGVACESCAGGEDGDDVWAASMHVASTPLAHKDRILLIGFPPLVTS